MYIKCSSRKQCLRRKNVNNFFFFSFFAPQEALKREKEKQENINQKMERIESTLDNLSTRFARLLSDFNCTQLKLKQRLTKVEKMLSRDGDAISNVSAVELDSK